MNGKQITPRIPCQCPVCQQMLPRTTDIGDVVRCENPMCKTKLEIKEYIAKPVREKPNHA